MAKYVQPNFIVDSSASFLRNVAFDSSVYIKGVLHISSPIGSSSSLNTLVVDSIGSDVQIKYRTLGTMSLESAASWEASLGLTETDITNLETSVGALDLLTQKHDASIGVHTTQIGLMDVSIGNLYAYDIIQDSSISKNWSRWIDSNRTGFLNQVETTMSLNDTTGQFTLADAGSGWSYYRGGIKYTISGNKSITLPGGGSATAGTYFITIESSDGTLSVSTTPWSLSGNTVLVAYIIWDPANTPKYWLGEERHSMLIDRRMHQYLHTTQGTKFVSGGVLTGPTVGGTTDASNAIGIAATTIADEDIFQTLSALTRPANPLSPGNNYVVFYRTSPSTWSWKFEDLPLPASGSYIEWDNNGILQTGQDGKYYNTYLAYTNLNGIARYMIIPGRGEFDTIEDAANENIASFDFTGLPAKEFVLAWQFIWGASTGLGTVGKVSLATEAVPVNVNLTTASAPATVDHNNLLGLQGGTASERYHLTLSQWQDYAGKSYVDASLAVRDTRLTNHDSSLLSLNGLIQTNITDINNIETSLGVLNNWNVSEDASIVALRTRISNHDISIAGLDTLTQTHTTEINNLETSVGALDILTQSQTNKNISQDASIVALRAYDAIQDASIALAISGTTNAWNGLTRLDNSIGLGGTLQQNTDIITNGKLFSVTGGMSIFGDLTVDGSVTYVNSVDLNVSDNMITVNFGEDASGVAKGFAGIKVDRGTAEYDYVFVFAEATETFRVGLANESGLPTGTQAVATREDNPLASGLAVWNTAERRFDTFAGLKYEAGSGLTVNKLAITNPGSTASETTALFLLPDGSVATRDLGTGAFSNIGDYATLGYVDGSLAVQTSWNTSQDASIVALRTRVSNLETSVGALDVLTQTHTTDINNLETSVGILNNWNISQDASIARIDASLNDTIDALDLFYEKAYIDGSFGARDTSIAWLNSNKVNKSGDTMTGLLTFSSAGFVLDGQTITDIDVSGNLTDLDSHIPTSGAVKNYIDSLPEGATAWNGLTKTGSQIGLGGTLEEATHISGPYEFSIDSSYSDFRSKIHFNSGDVQGLILDSIDYSNNKNSTVDINRGYIQISVKDQFSSNTNSILFNESGNSELELYSGALTIRVYGQNALDEGLVYYENDYSQYYKDRTLPDWGNVRFYVDSSIQPLIDKDLNIDTSLNDIWGYIQNTLEPSIYGLIDGSISEVYGYIQNTLEPSIYGLIDGSISELYGYIDSSISQIYDYINDDVVPIIDASIERIDASLNSISSNALKTASNGLTDSEQNVKLGGTLTESTDIITNGNLFSVTGALSVFGNLTVDGSVTYVNSVDLNVSDNIITVNYGETGSGVSKGFAGLKVDRGSEDDYVLVFSESTDTFRIGIANESGLPTGTQAVATREDTPVVNGIGFWNNTLFRIDTSAGFIFTPGVGLGLPIATNMGSESTALVWNGTTVGSRELGTMAFETAANYTTLIYVDGSLAARDTSIAFIANFASEVSTNKLTNVATITGITGGHEVYSNTANNVAYIKKIVAGTGATITSDASTITIAVSGAAGYVSKYTGTFDGTAGTSLAISAATHGLGIGPFNVTVYDGVQLVYVDVEVDGSGNVTFYWSSGSLSASCKYIIAG